MTSHQEPSELDRELFELCREVSQRTDWDTDELDYLLRLHKPMNMVTKVSAAEFVYDTLRFAHKPETRRFNEENEVVPLYTSDYILDKLPGNTGVEKLYKPKDEDGYFYISYLVTAKNSRLESRTNAGGDTPLKALLKLVLALDDAKELV